MMVSHDHINPEIFGVGDRFVITCPTVNRDETRSCLMYFVDEIGFHAISILDPMWYTIADLQSIFTSKKEEKGGCRCHSICVIITKYHHAFAVFLCLFDPFYNFLYVWQ